MRNSTNLAASPPTSDASATAWPAGAAGPTAATGGGATHRPRLVAGGLVAGVAVTAAVLAWHPGPPRNDLSYAGFAPVRQAALTGALLDHIGWGVVALTFPLAVCLLVRVRGAWLASVGAALMALGGMFFVSTYHGVMLLAWYATDPGALPAETGTSFLSWVNDHRGPLVGPEAASFVAFCLGALLLAGSLWRSRVAPRWVPAAIAVITVAQFATPAGALDVVQILFLASLLPVAWLVLRPGSRPGVDPT